MSVDLLSEFDAFYQGPRQAATGAPSGSSTLSFFDDLLSLDSTPASSATTTNATSTTTGNTGAQHIPWPHQSPERSVPKAAATTGPWGGSGSFSTQSGGNPALAETSLSEQDDSDDQWGDFESFETAAVKPASPITDPSRPLTSPQKATSAYERFASPPSVGLPQASKMAIHSKARLSTTPPKTSYAQFASNAQARSNNRQRSSSLRNQVFPDPQPQRTKPVTEVLFDATAEALGNDDEFGDFETSVSPQPTASAPSTSSRSRASSRTFKGPALSVDSGLAVNPTPSPYPKAPKSPSFQERNPFAGMSISTVPAPKVEKEKGSNSPTPITAWPSFESPKPAPYKDSPGPEDESIDGWGDFIESPTKADKNQRRDSSAGWIFPAPGAPEAPLKILPKPINSTPPTSDKDASRAANNKTSGSTPSTPSTPFPSNPEPAPIRTSSRAIPPTNVPPPSILLSLFPSLFNLPQSSLISPLFDRSPAVKTRVFTNPSTVSFLKAYLALATVAAHIIAARKLRWKRDTHLAQGTKIGPATRGGGGMKLTGVDRAESLREDREVAEVVRAWKEQLGSLRSAVSITNGGGDSAPKTPRALPPIPEITLTPTILTAPPSSGGLKSPNHCALCGLNRDERVDRVDVDVEDTFGEFWIEFWGHRTCRNFWEEHRERLAQR
ncbi:hypothetical protein FGG08_007236 [Glutinoglossum americanum]|uniref:Serine/threonine-protein kinase ppk6 n=1 Tax=Glutinoglossum americanum TaxID=1670608 RepID=A0A9P8HWR0_9PEZI|nr:hypothetical protein FGG08_007236 [Glutinoglossum americanum]